MLDHNHAPQNLPKLKKNNFNWSSYNPLTTWFPFNHHQVTRIGHGHTPLHLGMKLLNGIFHRFQVLQFTAAVPWNGNKAAGM